MFDKQLRVIISAVDKATGPLKGIGKQVDSFSNKLDGMKPTFQKMSGIGAAAITGIGFAIRGTLDDAGKLESALKGLESVTVGMGEDFGDAKTFLNSFTKDGLVPMNNAATALKNLMASGFSLSEATVLMDRFKDSASFGRQASLSLGEAVQSATEGIKNQNSILVDNAGVTKNISVMQEEYAKSIGTTVNNLTDAQKNEAIYQGVLKETTFQVGDAQKASEGYQGQVARLNASKVQLSQTIGGTLMPIMANLLQTITPIIQNVTEWIGKNPELTKNLIIGATAVAGLVTVLGTLGLVIPTIITGFSVMTAGLTAVKFAFIAVVGPITILIALLATLAVMTVQNWDQIKQGFNDGIEAVKIYVNTLPIFLSNIWTKIKENIDEILIRGVLGVLTLGLSEIFIQWSGGWDSVVNYVYTAVQPMVDWVKGKLDAIVGFIAKIKSALSSAKSFLGGGSDAVSTPVAGARAFGGTTMANKSYLVGERGPEIFTPASTGKISQPSNSSNVTINMGGVTVTNEADENRLVDKINQVLVRNTQLYNYGII